MESRKPLVRSKSAEERIKLMEAQKKRAPLEIGIAIDAIPRKSSKEKVISPRFFVTQPSVTPEANKGSEEDKISFEKK